MPGQSNSTFRAILDTLTLPYKKPDVLQKTLLQNNDSTLGQFFKIDAKKGASGLKTFEGRYVKVPINALYPVTYGQVNDFNIQHGDIKQQKGAKNVIYAEFAAVDKGITFGITTYDLQMLKQKGTDAQVDWITQYQNDTFQAFAVSLKNSIYNGLGATATNSNGDTKPDFDGFVTSISTSAYGGKSSNDYYEWQAQSFDWTTTLFGETTVTTTAAATTVATGSLNTPFYNVLMHSVEKCKQFSSKRNLMVVMHPAIYTYCWLPSLEVNVKSSKLINANSKDIVGVDRNATFLIDGTPVYAETASLPSQDIGSKPQYIFPTNLIYIIDLDSVNLQVESSNNFAMGDWIEIPNQYNALQKSMSTTLLFFQTRRFSSAVITLNATLAAAASTQYGI